MLKRCFLIGSISLTLLSGLAQAELTAKKVNSYGLYISNWGMTLVSQPYNEDVTTYSATTLSNSELLGDPPTLVYNDSPVAFLMFMLKPDIAKSLRLQNEQFGKDVERQLYIGAAGYDGVESSRLSERIKKTIKVEGVKQEVEKTLSEWIRSAIDSSRINKTLDIDVNQALTDAGCYLVENKAEFHHCALRWALEYRTGIHIKPEHSVMEQDNELMTQMASDLILQHKLQPNLHFILHATSLLQPYALDASGHLIYTPGWMGSGAWYDEGNLTRAGGSYMVGQNYAASFSANSLNPLNLLIQAKIQERIDNGERFYGGTTEKNAEDVAKNLRSYVYRNNAGAMVLDIADPRNKSVKPTDITTQELAQAQKDAAKLVDEVRDQGALSFALLYGLLQPSVEGDSYIVVVGELRKLYTDFDSLNLSDMLNNLGKNQDELNKAFNTYKKLITENKLSSFDVLNKELMLANTSSSLEATNKKVRASHHLNIDMDDQAFKNWLISLSSKIEDKVLYTPEEEYGAALMNACKARYTNSKP